MKTEIEKLEQLKAELKALKAEQRKLYSTRTITIETGCEIANKISKIEDQIDDIENEW